MDLFTDIYNKVMGFFRRTDAEETSKESACNRLRVVLMQDRTNLNPHLLEKMRKELIELLSKYVEMDKEALELNFEQEGEQMALMLSIPVLRAKPEEEIEKALEEGKSDEEPSEDSAEDVTEEAEPGENAQEAETSEEDEAEDAASDVEPECEEEKSENEE